ncbi:MAG: response regulator [Deltaproteobacteria bacterium]|nr:response regulator [Deltaproteobacteria bacterium]
MGKTYRCEACGEGVEGYTVELGGGVSEVRCLSCGLPLEKSGNHRGRFRRVLVADDSPFFTEGLESFLLERKLAGEVSKAPDGAQALELAVVALREKRPFTLAVLDFMMPRLNGFHCAVALRSVEKAFAPSRCAIVFLSSRRLDPSFRPALEELKPAYYVNKGAGGETGLLGDRLEAILRAVASQLTLGT